ncbi:MAG: NAD(P)H-hydrate dehydratase [Clostridia bacterium]|nr:NAD(P)H-hydrate dehydratase [Clostridia bacterium]
MKDLFSKLPDRTNKGDMGRLLVVCGSYNAQGTSMCGAAYFSAAAAYRTGAGIVEIFTPRENYPALATLVPEAIFSLYGYEEQADAVTARLAEAIFRSDAVVIGCGLGKSALARALVRAALLVAACPLLIDADALNIISEDEGLWSLLDEKQRAQTVITPHPGEMSRLCGDPIGGILSDTPKCAKSFAENHGMICLLKDHHTAISDGERVYLNQSGNAGMASAGMGDLLAGIIGALLARESKNNFRNSDVFECTAVGAHLHGLAGDLAAEKYGEYSVTASVVLSEIPAAIMRNFSNNTQN